MKPLACLVLVSLATLTGCDASRVERPAAPYVVTHDIFVGTGPGAGQGDTLTVQHQGWLADGTLFDASTRRPFWFVLGTAQVIRGWDLGLSGMRAGGRRRLVIPPELAYGAAGLPPVVPPNATLVFEVTLLEVRPKR